MMADFAVNECRTGNIGASVVDRLALNAPFAYNKFMYDFSTISIMYIVHWRCRRGCVARLSAASADASDACQYILMNCITRPLSDLQWASPTAEEEMNHRVSVGHCASLILIERH